MASNKKYFQDHFILLLLSTNVFLALSTIIIMLARFSDGRGGSFFTQYRESLGIGEYQRGSISELLAFMIFAAIVATVHTVLSHRTYKVSRHLSITILALGIVLLLMAIIISNALLALR